MPAYAGDAQEEHLGDAPHAQVVRQSRPSYHYDRGSGVSVGSLPRPLPEPPGGCQHDVCTGNGVSLGIVMAKGNLKRVANIGQGCRPDAPLRPCEMNCADEPLQWRTQAIA